MSETTGTAHNSDEERAVTSSNSNESPKNEQQFESDQNPNDVHENAPNSNDNSNFAVQNDDQNENPMLHEENEIPPNDPPVTPDSNTTDGNELEAPNDQSLSSQNNEIEENNLTEKNAVNYTNTEANPNNQEDKFIATNNEKENISNPDATYQQLENISPGQQAVDEQEQKGFEDQQRIEEQQKIEVQEKYEEQQQINQQERIDAQQIIQNPQNEGQSSSNIGEEHQQIEEVSKSEPQPPVEDQQISNQSQSSQIQSQQTDTNQPPANSTASIEQTTPPISYTIESITASPTNPTNFSEVPRKSTTHPSYQFDTNINEITIDPVKEINPNFLQQPLQPTEAPNLVQQQQEMQMQSNIQPLQPIPNQFQPQFMQMAAFVPPQQPPMMQQNVVVKRTNASKQVGNAQANPNDIVQTRRFVASQPPIQHMQYQAQTQQFAQGQLHPRQQLQQLPPIQPFQMQAMAGMAPFQPQTAQFQQQFVQMNQKGQLMQMAPLQPPQQAVDPQMMQNYKMQKQPKHASAAPYPSLPTSQQIQEIINSLTEQIEAEKAELTHLERAKKLGIFKPVDYRTRDPKLEVQYHLGFIIPHQMVNIVKNQSHSRAVESQAKYVLSGEQIAVQHRFPDIPHLRDQITRNEELAEPMLKTLGNWKSMNLEKANNLVHDYVCRRSNWEQLKKSIDQYNHESRRTIESWPPEFANTELKSSLPESLILSRVAPDEPMYLDELEKKEFTFYDMNRYVEDPVAEHLAYKRRLVWTDAEIKTFLERYAQHPREFKRIATALPSKCVKDVIEFYNIHRIDLNLKELEVASQKKGMRKKMISEGSVRK